MQHLRAHRGFRFTTLAPVSPALLQFTTCTLLNAWANRARSHRMRHIGRRQQSLSSPVFTARILQPCRFCSRNLLSAEECERVVSLGRNLVTRSTFGNAAGRFVADSRTSKTAWLNRGMKGTFTDRLFRRFCDVLSIPENRLCAFKRCSAC